jgi:hypothetical protein
MTVKALLARIAGVALAAAAVVTFNPASAEAATGLQFQKIYYTPGAVTPAATPA